jgi:C-methyltransferase-like protein/methyltransferase family protein/putative zinc binding protein
MRRTSCSACGSPDLEIFLDLGDSPIADAYADTADEALASPQLPLQVALCAKCKLAQLLEVVDQETLFGTGYSFYSSASPPLSRYHANYAFDLLERYGQFARRGVLEIGCNDGDMLRHFAGFNHLGVDPAAGPVSAARERGLAVAEMPFGLDLAQTLHPAGLIIANHVLAHVADVSDFLAGIALLADGIVMIEVQYLPDLLVNNAFDLVYHEHRNFFSLTSLEQAASRHGLAVVDVELTDRQGGSLRATLTRQRDPQTSVKVDMLRASEAWLSSFGAYEGMQGRAERIRARLRDLISGRGGGVALYGAPAKATTLLNFCKLGDSEIPFCWDSTPAKQGRFIPGVGIPILPPWGDSGRPETFVLAAWNYAASIVRANPGFRWIMPFPAPWLLP